MIPAENLENPVSNKRQSGLPSPFSASNHAQPNQYQDDDHTPNQDENSQNQRLTQKNGGHDPPLPSPRGKKSRKGHLCCGKISEMVCWIIVGVSVFIVILLIVGLAVYYVSRNSGKSSDENGSKGL